MRRWNTSGTPQSIGVAPVDEPSPLVELLPARPNPLNPRTRIRLRLASSLAVDVRIHDLRGRLVKQLRPRSTMEPGTHELEWDGTDERGIAVASGSYLCVLRTEGRFQSRPLVVVR